MQLDKSEGAQQNCYAVMHFATVVGPVMSPCACWLMIGSKLN